MLSLIATVEDTILGWMDKCVPGRLFLMFVPQLHCLYYPP